MGEVPCIGGGEQRRAMRCVPRAGRPERTTCNTVISHKVFFPSTKKRQLVLYLPKTNVSVSFILVEYHKKRQLILYTSNSKGQVHGFVGELTSAKRL